MADPCQRNVRTDTARPVEPAHRASRGAWREAKAHELLAAAEESIELWAGRAPDFEELAGRHRTEVHLPANLNAEIAAMGDRNEAASGGQGSRVLGVTPRRLV